MLIEVNGPGSMYAEVARIIVLGSATLKLKDEFAVVKEAQDHTLSLMKRLACASRRTSFGSNLSASLRVKIL